MFVDPLAEETMEPYLYTGNNPIMFTDPTGMSKEDWIKNDKTGEYIWDSKVTSAANTPDGFSYVGKEDQSIIKDLGWNADYKSLTSKKMGRVVLDENSAGMTTVTANSNIRVNANVTSNMNMETGEISKKFNGVDIGVGVKGTATGTESIGVTGIATTTFGGKDYAVGLRDVKFNKSSQVTQSETSNIYGNLFIPAKNIYSQSGVKHFPGVKIKGSWSNVKSDGSGAVPVTRLLMFPLEYNHTYNPFSPKSN